MYAILVNEPGAETKSYVLPTGASTPKAAVQLMFSRAEEYISEQLELGTEGAEDYKIEAVDHFTVVVRDLIDGEQSIRLQLEATPIAEVV